MLRKFGILVLALLISSIGMGGRGTIGSPPLQRTEGNPDHRYRCQTDQETKEPSQEKETTSAPPSIEPSTPPGPLPTPTPVPSPMKPTPLVPPLSPTPIPIPPGMGKPLPPPSQ